MSTSEADVTLHRALGKGPFAARRGIGEDVFTPSTTLSDSLTRRRAVHRATRFVDLENKSDLTGDLDAFPAKRIDAAALRSGSTIPIRGKAAVHRVRDSTALSLPREQHVSRAQRAPPGANALPRPPWWSVVAALAAVAAATWWLMVQRVPDIDPRQVVATNLAAARAAIDDGRLIEPPEHSAVHYYGSVLALDPANGTAVEGLDRIAARYVEDAKRSILSARFADAVDAIEHVRRVRPGHRRLAYLEAQLQKALADHVSAMNAAASPDAATGSSVRAQPAQVIDAPALAAAQRHDEQTDSIAARVRDARQESLAAANEAIDGGNLFLARERIGEARRLGVAKQDLATLSEALESAQRQEASAGLLELVLKRTAEGRLSEPAQDSAKHYLGRLTQTDPTFGGLQQGIEKLGGQFVENARRAIEKEDFTQAVRLLTQAREIGFDNAQITAAEEDLRVARSAAENVLRVVAPVEPKLISVVEPDYPRAARVRNIEGWVDLNLSVTPAGKVDDAYVLRREGSRSFERAALAAVRQWQYEPTTPADPNTRQSVEVRVAFRLEE